MRVFGMAPAAAVARGCRSGTIACPKPARMNLVDLILVAVVAASLWGGWHRGFAVGAAELVALLASAAFALAAYQLPARWLGGEGFGVWAMPLAFLGTFLVARVVLGLLAGRLLAALPAQAHQHRANRVLGLLPGAASGLIHAVIVAALLLALPLFDGLTGQAGDSVLAQHLSRPAQWLEARLSPQPRMHAGFPGRAALRRRATVQGPDGSTLRKDCGQDFRPLDEVK